VFNVVAANKHKLSLPVEAERVDQPEPRLAGPTTGNAESMCEGQTVDDREHDQGGDAASRQEPDLKDPIVRERKFIQPLHAQSKTSAAERARNTPLFIFASRTGAREARSSAASDRIRRAAGPAPNPIDARPCHIS
jgi:hypothetical protein